MITVSRTESGQAKRFLFLNENFGIQSEIPVEYGRRYFDLTDGNKDVNELKKGDMIRWTTTKKSIDEMGPRKLKEFEEEMKNKGKINYN